MKDIRQVKKDAICVKFLLDEMKFSAHVVIADCDHHRVMDFTRENFLMYSLQKRGIMKCHVREFVLNSRLNGMHINSEC
jgi:hypothetical protein